MAGEDKTYSEWIRSQPCAMCAAPPPSEQHHKCGAGMAQRAHDWYSMPLCQRCHHERIHGGMPKADRRAFEFNKCLEYRESYMGDAEPSAGPEEVF